MPLSLIKENSKLREAIKSRMAELKLTQDALSNLALTHGKKVSRLGINKYLKGGQTAYSQGAITDINVIFIALLLDVPVFVVVGYPSHRIDYNVPRKYDRERALGLLKSIFPETIIPEEEPKKKKK